MAFIRTDSTDDTLSLAVNNGDLVALREAVQRLGFRDEESLLRFMLAVISKSATRSVAITDQSGARITITPSNTLVRPDAE